MYIAWRLPAIINKKKHLHIFYSDKAMTLTEVSMEVTYGK